MSHRETGLIEPATVSAGIADMVWIAGGTFRIGSDHHYDKAPQHPHAQRVFDLDQTAHLAASENRSTRRRSGVS